MSVLLINIFGTINYIVVAITLVVQVVVPSDLPSSKNNENVSILYTG
jgi:hypothetical protein